MNCSIMDGNCQGLSKEEITRLIRLSILFCCIFSPIVFYNLYKLRKVIREYRTVVSGVLSLLSVFCMGAIIGQLIEFVGYYNPIVSFHDYSDYLNSAIKKHKETETIGYYSVVVFICCCLFWLSYSDNQESVELIDVDLEESLSLDRLSNYFYILGLILIALHLSPLFIMILI